MVKEYEILKLEKNIKKELRKMKALHELRTGEQITYGKLIKMLIDTQPEIDIRGKVKSNV